MPKGTGSKTQAQKKEEREAKQKEAAEKRAEEKRLRDEAFKREAAQNRATQATKLTAKERRELKKAGKSEAEASSSSAVSLAAVDPHLDNDFENTDTDPGADPDDDLDSTVDVSNSSSSAAAVQMSSLVSSNNATASFDADGCVSSSSEGGMSSSFYGAVLKRTDQAVAQRIESDKQAQTGAESRIVCNHSTHCEGLRPVLVRLEKQLLGCTITPGKLSQVQAHQAHFSLELQREKTPNSYKLVARNGKTVQDVFISVSDPKTYTEDVICDAVEAAQASRLKATDTSSVDDVCFSHLNREVANQRSRLWTEDHKQKDQAQKAKARAAQEAQGIRDQERKLANKNVDPEQRRQLAERDVAIISGASRTKHSMKK